MIWLIGFNWTIMSKTNGVAIRDKRGRYLKGMPVAGRLASRSKLRRDFLADVHAALAGAWLRRAADNRQPRCSPRGHREHQSALSSSRYFASASFTCFKNYSSICRACGPAVRPKRSSARWR